MAWLAQPPDIGRKQEVPLATADGASLTDTIATQLQCIVTVTPDVHPLQEDLGVLGLLDSLCGRAALLTSCSETLTCVIFTSLFG